MQGLGGFLHRAITVTYLLALWLKDSTQVFDLGVWCFSGFTGLFPIVFAAVCWWRATLAGVFASLLATTVTWSLFFVQDVVLNRADGDGGKFLIFGLMPVAVIFVSSALALVVVSLLTKPPPRATVDRFFLES